MPEMILIHGQPVAVPVDVESAGRDAVAAWAAAQGGDPAPTPPETTPVEEESES